MSETISTPIETPVAAEPGPTTGTSVGVAETTAPAASSPEPASETVVAESAPVVEAPVETAAETTTEDRAPSLLSEAKPDEPAKPETKPAETKAEEPKAETVAEPAKPSAPPKYESFALPDGVTIADEKMGAYTGILGEYENKIIADPAQAHAMVQEMGQKLVDFYVGEMRDNAERTARMQRDTWDRTIETWRGEFRDDPEIGGNRTDTSLARMGGLLEMYGQKAGSDRLSKLRDVFTTTGAGDNPEVLRFVNWAASRLVETPRPVAAITPRAPVVTSRAQRLYRNTTGAA